MHLTKTDKAVQMRSLAIRIVIPHIPHFLLLPASALVQISVRNAALLCTRRKILSKEAHDL